MTLEHQEVREKLIASTLDLMAQGGIEAVKARVLAETAGVSVGTVYNLFGNVDGVMEFACARLFEKLNALGRARIDEIRNDFAGEVARDGMADTPRNRLLHALLSLSLLYVGFVGENERSWAALLAFNRSRSDGAVAEWYQAMPAELIGILAETLGDAPGMADEVRRTTLAWALWSSVHGIVTMSYVGQAHPEALARTKAQIEALVSLVVDGIYAG